MGVALSTGVRCYVCVSLVSEADSDGGSEEEVGETIAPVAKEPDDVSELL